MKTQSYTHIHPAFSGVSEREFFGFVLENAPDTRANRIGLREEGIFLPAAAIPAKAPLVAVTSFIPDLGWDESGFAWAGLDKPFLVERFSRDEGYSFDWLYSDGGLLTPIEDEEMLLALNGLYQDLRDNKGVALPVYQPLRNFL